MVAIWCPGRESYAITDTTNRCLSFVWWRECSARWAEVRYIAKPHYRGSPVLLLAGSVARWEASLWPAGSRRLFEPWLSSNPGHATPDSGEMERVFLGSGFRKKRWLRGSGTPDSCDWSNGPFLDWQRRSTVALRKCARRSNRVRCAISFYHGWRLGPRPEPLCPLRVSPLGQQAPDRNCQGDAIDVLKRQ